MTLRIDAHSLFPVRSAARIELRTPRTSMPRAMIQSGGLLGYLKGVLRRAAREPSFIRADAHLLTPVTQMVDIEFTSGFGSYQYMNLTSLAPVARDRTLFVYSAYIRRADGTSFGPLLRRLADAYLKHSIEVAHIKGEDEAMLAATPYREDFFATPWDDTVKAIRTLFARYVAEKAHLYPAGSLLHSLGCAYAAASLRRAAGPHPPE
jgi:hypothetical protein